MFTNKHKICIYLFIHARKNVKLFNYDKVEKYQKFCRIFKEFFEDLFLCFISLQKWKHFHTKYNDEFQKTLKYLNKNRKVFIYFPKD